MRPPPSTERKKGPANRALRRKRSSRGRSLLLELDDDIHRGADAHGDVDGLRLVAGARDRDRVCAGIRDDAARVGGKVPARAEVLVVDVDGGVLWRDLEPHARAVTRRPRQGLIANVDALFGGPLAGRRSHAAIAPSVVTRRALRWVTRRWRGLFLRPGTALREDAAEGRALRLGRELVERALAGLELQLLVETHALAAGDVEIRREHLIPRKAEFEVVLPGSEVEVVGPAVEVVGGSDVLAVEENQRLFGRDVGLHDRVAAGPSRNAGASVFASGFVVAVAVAVARYDVDAWAAPPPRGVVGRPAPAPPPAVMVVTPAAAVMPAVPPAAVPGAAVRATAVRVAHPAARVARPPPGGPP